jgi:branched-chain amino acid transport system substrate-binding protein
MKALRCVTVALSLLPLAGAASAAEVTIGFSVSATGPAASLGIPSRNTVALLPTTIGGVRVRYVVLDDATDSTTAVKNARKLTSEDHADVIVGSNTTPNSLAMTDVAAETGTPLIAMCGNAVVVEPMDAKKRWVFKTPQNDALMAEAIAQHMAEHGVKTAGYIGFADAYGDGWWAVFQKAAQARKIQLLAPERYNRADTSVTGQVLKLLAARPDAVLVGASGTPAALPQRTLVERGYRGKVYQTHGVANPDFLRVGGKDVEGAILPAGPVLVAAQLPDSHPSKKAGLDYVKRYEAANGPGTASAFGAHAWDAGLLLQASIPLALKRAQPGTREFRAALRDALEEHIHGVAAAHGVFDMTPTNHNGLDRRARVMVEVRNGAWHLVQ